MAAFPNKEIAGFRLTQKVQSLLLKSMRVVTLAWLALALGFGFGFPVASNASILRNCRQWLTSAAPTSIEGEKIRQLAELDAAVDRMDLRLKKLGCTAQSFPDECLAASYNSLSGQYLYCTLRHGRRELLEAKGGSGTGNDAPFLEHCRFQERLHQVHRLGARIVVDPGLAHGAYFLQDTIYLHPEAKNWVLEHEFAHLVEDRAKKNERGLAGLGTALAQEFGEIADIVEKLRKQTRFSPVTLGEFFAVLHQKRLMSEPPSPDLITADDTYLLSYVAHEFRTVDPANPDLTPEELRWWKLLPTPRPPALRARFPATALALMFATLSAATIEVTTLEKLESTQAIQRGSAQLAQKILDSTHHDNWSVTRVELDSRANEIRGNSTVALKIQSDSGEVAQGRFQVRTLETPSGLVVALSRQPDAQTFVVSGETFKMVIHRGPDGVFIQNGSMGLGDGTETLNLPLFSSQVRLRSFGGRSANGE